MKKQFSITFIIAVISAGIGAYIQHRYDQQPQVKTVEVDKAHIVTTIKETKHKDGTLERTVVIVSDKDKKLTETVKTPVKQPRTNVSLLVADDLSTRPRPRPEYGVSITREFIGPITIGAFGLTNGVIGVSVGINF